MAASAAQWEEETQLYDEQPVLLLKLGASAGAGFSAVASDEPGKGGEEAGGGPLFEETQAYGTQAFFSPSRAVVAQQASPLRTCLQGLDGMLENKLDPCSEVHSRPFAPTSAPGNAGEEADCGSPLEETQAYSGALEETQSYDGAQAGVSSFSLASPSREVVARQASPLRPCLQG
jgi:hypothetical protein